MRALLLHPAYGINLYGRRARGAAMLVVAAALLLCAAAVGGRATTTGGGTDSHLMQQLAVPLTFEFDTPRLVGASTNASTHL